MQIDGTKTQVAPFHTEYRINETKCRRCGMITRWCFLRYNEFTRQQAMSAMFEKMQQPTLCRCDKCNGNTVQDYVSFDNDCPEEILNKTKQP